MHQSVISYDVAPAAMTAVPHHAAGHDASLDRHAAAEPPAPCAPSVSVPALSAYLTAAGIACSLVAAWAALCTI